MTDEKLKADSPKDNPNAVKIVCREGEDPQLASARMLIGPHVTNAHITTFFGRKQFGELLPLPAVVTAMTEMTKRVNANNMQDVEDTLMSQATTLNIMFGELSRRSAANMGEHLEASERYLRLALKAQNQCRMTLETLSNIKNPPVIYAKQANIANGPQQVNNTLHAHAGENKNQPIKVLEQGHESRMDTGAESTTGAGDSAMEAMATSHGAQVTTRQGHRFAQRVQGRRTSGAQTEHCGAETILQNQR